jgi:hypothetical protein
VWHAVIHEIGGAIDHLHALRMLILTAEALHTFAPIIKEAGMPLSSAPRQH